MPETAKIDQRYTIIRNIAGGLSGEVCFVSDPEGHNVALKFLKKIQRNVSREEALRNFKNKFEILKQLNHPNIARILDFVLDTWLQKYYFTTEFIEGAEFHKACQGQPIYVVEKIIVQVLRALNYLHSRGIYHFDIKPQNILVQMKNGDPQVAKIIDFGLAGFTPPRKKVGTPAYMAPEVIRGGLLDGRTDLYSLGVVIYRTLTGVNPFAAKSLRETRDNQLQVRPKPPSARNQDIPDYWDHILERLLEKDPVNRYSQASLVIRDLNFLSNKKFDVETKDTKLSYLPERGILIGPEKEWHVFTELFNELKGPIQGRGIDDLLKTYEKLIEVLIRRTDFDSAEKYCREARAALSKSAHKKPFDLIFKNLWAYIHLKRGHLDEAQRLFEQTLFYCYLSLAEFYIKEKQFQKAARAQDKADKILETTPALKYLEFWEHIRRAQILYGQKKTGEGQKELDRARELARTRGREGGAGQDGQNNPPGA